MTETEKMSAVFKIMNFKQSTSEGMPGGRGEKIKLINTTLGTHNVDVHLNRLATGGPRGKVHHHTNADNVYIVKRGEGTLTLEGETHVVREYEVIFFPAVMKHSLSNLGEGVFEIFEIYAPAGRHFDFVLDE